SGAYCSLSKLSPKMRFYVIPPLPCYLHRDKERPPIGKRRHREQVKSAEDASATSCESSQANRTAAMIYHNTNTKSPRSYGIASSRIKKNQSVKRMGHRSFRIARNARQ